MTAQPTQLSIRARAAHAGEPLGERVGSWSARLDQPVDVLVECAQCVGEWSDVQVRHDLGIVEAVVAELAAADEPTPRVDEQTRARLCGTRPLGAIEGKAVVANDAHV